MQIATKLEFVQQTFPVRIEITVAQGTGLGYWIARHGNEYIAHIVHIPSGQELVQFYVEGQSEVEQTIQDIIDLDFNWNRPMPSLKADRRYQKVRSAFNALFFEEVV